MNNKYLLGIILALGTVFYSCDDLFEDNEPVVLLAPSNYLITTNTTITFWWDSIQGATKYNLQVVSESFKDIQIINLDTITKKNKLKKTLPVGKYQWKVVAFNNSIKTISDTNSFEIRSKVKSIKQTLNPINR